MNYTQQRRIEQITENTLIVGVDIAKAKHVARAQDNRGIELGKRLIFENSNTGFIKLLSWIQQIKQKHAKGQIVCGMEPTGHYWLPLAQYLHEAEILWQLIHYT